MLSNVWAKHFNLALVAVVLVGLVVGVGLAAIFTPTPPAVIAESTGLRGNPSAQAGGTAAARGTAAGQGASAQGTSTQASTGAGSRPVFGSVGSVTAGAITVKEQQGDVNVKLTGAKIVKTVAGSATDLKAGERVSVVGQKGTDGTYTASTIQILAAQQSRGGTGNAQGNNGASAPTNGSSAQSQQGGQTRTRPLVGSVASVDNGVMTVTTQQGDEKVTLAGAKIEKAVDATAKDLQSGEQVVVTGQQNSDGSYTATEVQILPTGTATADAQSSQIPSGQPGPSPTATK